MMSDGPTQQVKPLLNSRILQFWSALISNQQVRAARQTSFPRQSLRQQGGLIVLAFNQSGPMQRDRSNQSISRQQRFPNSGHPQGCRARDFRTIPVLQRQNQLASPPFVYQRRSPSAPWARVTHAVVALDPEPVCRAHHRNAAQLANRSGHKGRVTPARPTQTKVTVHKFAAPQASRRVDQLNRRLKTGPHRFR